MKRKSFLKKYLSDEYYSSLHKIETNGISATLKQVHIYIYIYIYEIDHRFIMVSLSFSDQTMVAASTVPRQILFW